MHDNVNFPAQPGLAEAIIDPQLPIVDAHHHLWFQPESRLQQFEESSAMLVRTLAPIYRRYARYLFDEFIADISSGHNIVGSIFVDSHLMYRAGGADHLRSVGEIEFVNGIAAMSASGNFGAARICEGIVGHADLTLGDRLEELLVALRSAAKDRLKGVRCHIARDDDPEISPNGFELSSSLLHPNFNAGLRCLGRFGLSFDAFVFEPQLPQLIEAARACPETRIVVDHVGGPLGMASYAETRAERFPLWQSGIQELAKCQNVSVKLGGLGMPFGGFAYQEPVDLPLSARLAGQWRPYIETCIEAFGVERCMFGSNFPVDSATGDYSTLWNAFKISTEHASADERSALFAGTAIDIYRLHGSVAQ